MKAQGWTIQGYKLDFNKLNCYNIFYKWLYYNHFINGLVVDIWPNFYLVSAKHNNHVILWGSKFKTLLIMLIDDIQTMVFSFLF
jgi:hypothetical protein